jgi:hypothetical protein
MEITLHLPLRDWSVSQILLCVCVCLVLVLVSEEGLCVYGAVFCA